MVNNLRMLGILVYFTCAFEARSALTNLLLLTDNGPDVTDADSYARSIRGFWTTDEERCVMSWKWAALLRHQTSPAKENNVIINNWVKRVNNYGGMFCGTTQEELNRIWERMGCRSMRLGFPGHTVSEVEYPAGSNKYHLFDVSFGHFYRDKVTGEIVDIGKIRSDLTMQTIFSTVSSFPDINGYSMYEPEEIRSNRGEMTEFATLTSRQSVLANAGAPFRLGLKPFESYRRTWQELGDHSDYFTPYLGDSLDPNDRYLNPFVRTNGEWWFLPDLKAADFPEGVYRMTGMVGGGSPKIHPAAAGQWASVEFKIDPANVITSAFLTAVLVRGNASDSIRWSVSTDTGRTFQAVAGADSLGRFTVRHALKSLVAIRYGYILRLEIKAASSAASVGLDSLALRTVTQLNQRALPRLTLGSNRVLFRLGAQDSGSAFRPVEITYGWKEFRNNGIVSRYHVERVADSAGSHEYYINVAGWRDPEMEYVTLSFQGFNPLGPAVAAGYSDGVDTGRGCERPRYYFNYGLKNLFYQKKYTASVAPLSDANRVRLGDGQTAYPSPSSYVYGAKWQAGQNPVITLNLDSTAMAGGIRVLQAAANGYAEFADSIVVQTSEDSVSFERRGTIEETDLWFPPVNVLGNAKWDSRQHRAQKYWGHFLHKFDLVFDSSVRCRYVRLEIHNSATLSILEVEVRDQGMRRIPIVEELNNGFTLPQVVLEGPAPDPGRALTAARIDVSPNPSNPASVIRFWNPRSDITEVRIADAQGRCVRRIFYGQARTGWLSLCWNGKDDENSPVSSGLYIVVVKNGDRSMTRRIALIR